MTTSTNSIFSFARGASRWTNALASIPAALSAFVGTGFAFHTCDAPVIFSRYTLSYFVFLCAWFLIVVPATFLAFQFLLRKHVIELRSGRQLTVTPSLKLLVATLAFQFLVVFGVVLAQWELRAAATTCGKDSFHPFLQSTPRPLDAKANINKWGFRGDEIAKKKSPNEYRVFFFGGSAVFCGGIPYEVTHPAQLEQKLRQAHPNLTVQVQNVGADWHTSEHSLIKFLTNVQDFDPDLVVIYHAVNDLNHSFSPDLFGTGEYRNDYGHYYGAMGSRVLPIDVLIPTFDIQYGIWFSDLRFHEVRMRGPYGKGWHGFHRMSFSKARPVEVSEWPSLDAFQRNLRNFVQIAKSKQIDVIVASQPYLYRADLTDAEKELLWLMVSQQSNGTMCSLASMTAGMELFNETARKVSQQEDVLFVDLEKSVPKSTEYLFDDVHYTPKGCETIANEMYRAISHHEIIPKRMGYREANRPTERVSSSPSLHPER